MSEKKLKKILKLHRQWLEGNGGEQANLSWENLRGANFKPERQLSLLKNSEVNN